MAMGKLDWVSFVLVIIGGINWGLVGAFNFDLVASLLGSGSLVARIIYGLVGLSALYALLTVRKHSHHDAAPVASDSAVSASDSSSVPADSSAE